MKKFNKVLTGILALGTLFLMSNICSAGKFRTVIIDPGHGGKDAGGSYGKVYEKHLALDTSLRVNHLLQKKGYSTRMTRTSDVFISLSGRAAFANKYRDAIFVSIHYNYTYKKHIRGLETFYYSSRSKPLASYIQNGMLKRYRTSSRGVKFARYYVLRHTKHPSALVECGFVSNYSDRTRCKKAWYRQKMAEGIVDGIIKYQKARSKGWVR